MADFYFNEDGTVSFVKSTKSFETTVIEKGYDESYGTMATLKNVRGKKAPVQPKKKPKFNTPKQEPIFTSKSGIDAYCRVMVDHLEFISDSRIKSFMASLKSEELKKYLVIKTEASNKTITALLRAAEKKESTTPHKHSRVRNKESKQQQNDVVSYSRIERQMQELSDKIQDVYGDIAELLIESK